MTNDRLSGFEARLLRELQTVRTEHLAAAGRRARPQRRTLWASAATAVLIAAVVSGVLMLNAGSAAAYSVQPQSNGTLQVEINRSLTPADVVALRHDLAGSGATQTVTCSAAGSLQLVTVNPTGHPVVIATPRPGVGAGRSLAAVEAALRGARAGQVGCAGPH